MMFEDVLEIPRKRNLRINIDLNSNIGVYTKSMTHIHVLLHYVRVFEIVAYLKIRIYYLIRIV